MLRRVVPFTALLVLAVALFEEAAARRIRATNSASLIGPEVYDVVTRAQQPSATVERVILGDSVARQFFPAGMEPHDRVRFLTSNAGITFAGTFYMAEMALAACPNVREVVVMIRPENLRANLDWPYTNDYFNAHFHTLAQVAEVWKVRHDAHLTASQLGRWLLPSTFAINAVWRQEPRGFHSKPFTFAPADHASGDVELSDVASHYLKRLRDLTAARQVRLRMIPVPMPDDQRWTDSQRIFTEPMTYVSRESFADGIHLGTPQLGIRWCVGTSIAASVAAGYGLAGDLPQVSVISEEGCEPAAHPARIIEGPARR